MALDMMKSARASFKSRRVGEKVIYTPHVGGEVVSICGAWGLFLSFDGEVE